MGEIRIVENPHMHYLEEDWSRVRSPARARRRMARGFKQNVVSAWRPLPYALPDGSLVMHPELARTMRDLVAATPPHLVDSLIIPTRDASTSWMRA